MNALTTASETASALVERVVINGDLSKLTPQERVGYYNEVCKSVGLNPLTKPFEYITLNGKLTLYALRACTDQLRSVYAVSVEELMESEREGVFIVTAKVKNGSGRTDIAKGAVNIAGLKGEALANAMMKAETKAKRRATLSLCGLGWLDESEVDSIPGAVKGEPPANTQREAMHTPHTMTPEPRVQDEDTINLTANWINDEKANISAATQATELYQWLDENGESWSAPFTGSKLYRLKRTMPEAFDDIKTHYQAKLRALA